MRWCAGALTKNFCTIGQKVLAKPGEACYNAGVSAKPVDNGMAGRRVGLSRAVVGSYRLLFVNVRVIRSHCSVFPISF